MQILFLILLKPHLLHEKSVNIFSGSEAFTHLARWMPLLAKGTLPAMLPQAASYKGWGVHQQCWLCPCLLRLSHRSCQPWGGGGRGGEALRSPELLHLRNPHPHSPHRLWSPTVLQNVSPKLITLQSVVPSRQPSTTLTHFPLPWWDVKENQKCRNSWVKINSFLGKAKAVQARKAKQIFHSPIPVSRQAFRHFQKK